MKLSREQFQREANRVRNMIGARYRGLVNPQSKTSQRWDLITLVALIWTAIVTPVEVWTSGISSASAIPRPPARGLAHAPWNVHCAHFQVGIIPPGGLDVMWGINQFINIFFLLDIIRNFFI